MRNKFFILGSVLAISFFSGHAQRFTLLQMNQVDAEVNRILHTFNTYSSRLPGKDSLPEVPAEYLSLFKPDARIANVLAPSAKSQQPVSPETFYRYIREHFTFGLDFEISRIDDNLSRPAPTDMKNAYFIAYLPVSVKAIGLFDGQRISNISGDYYVVIGFLMEDRQVTEVAIHYIQESKPKIKYPKEYDAFLSPYMAPVFTRIHSRDIFTDEAWDAWGETGYRAGLKFIYRRNPPLGFYSGAGISSYRSVYEIKAYNNENLTKTVKTDVDGDEFYEIIRASVTENNSLMLFDIPLGIRFSTNGEKIRYTLQAGFDFSFLLSSHCSVTGNADHRGYYPAYHVILYDLPDYGFTGGQIDINEKWKLNPFNLAANVSMGAEISVSSNLILAISPFANAGLTDLGYDEPKYRDDYFSISGNPGKLSTRSAGLLFEVFFKL